MPVARNDGVDLHYETRGDGETVVFVPDLGCGAWLWSWQAPPIADGYETLVWDLRGCGRSTGGDEYSIQVMASDLEAVLSDADVRSATVVGTGLGGAIALSYARQYARVTGLVLLGTPPSGEQFDASAFLEGPDGFDSLLSSEFRATYPEEVDRIADWRREEDAPEDVKRAQAAAITDFDAPDWLYEVTVPALVAHGMEDEVVPSVAGEGLAEGLPRGEFDSFEEGSHFFFVEQSRLVTDRLVGFLESRD